MGRCVNLNAVCILDELVEIHIFRDVFCSLPILCFNLDRAFNCELNDIFIAFPPFP